MRSSAETVWSTQLSRRILIFFPFGVDVVVLKIAKLSSNVWAIAHSLEVQKTLGLGREGFIALAMFAGSDFGQGVNGVGAEKALQCVRGLLRQCDEASLKEKLFDALSKDLPAEFAQLARLQGCQTCKRCGHGPPKRAHGSKGCKWCGTESGCEARSGPCPCDFHARNDEVVLARSLSGLTLEQVRNIWAVYDEPPTSLPSLSWSRPRVDMIVDLLRDACNYPRGKVLKYILPALLLWDLTHPEEEAVFTPVSVVGVTGKGRLALIEWAGKDVEMEEALRFLSRERRGVSRTLAARFCPELVVKHCIGLLYKKSHACPKRLRNREHLKSEAEKMFKDWGLPVSPAVHEMIDALEQACCKVVDVRQLSLDAFFSGELSTISRAKRKRSH